MKRLSRLQEDTVYIRGHIEDVALSEDDLLSLEEAEKEFKEGKTTSLEDFEREMRENVQD